MNMECIVCGEPISSKDDLGEIDEDGEAVCVDCLDLTDDDEEDDDEEDDDEEDDEDIILIDEDEE